nr:hypothetical protein [uncultured Flavobacterium sp.]
MKKIVFLLFASALFTNCNDGDLIFDDLNFAGNVQKCNQKSIFYKLNGNEMLLLNMTNHINDETPLPLNQEFEISNSNNILYRQYSGKAIGGSVCDLIPPANPQVVTEYASNNGGTIKYKRIRQIIQPNNDSKVSINYVYTFNFQNIVLSNQDKQLKYEDYNFGEYINSSSVLDFNLGNVINFCENTAAVINKDRQIFKINSPEFVFTETVGSKTINLNNENYITFYILNQIVNYNEACEMNFSDPSTNIIEEWRATTGSIEIVTTANSTIENPEIITGYTHTLILKESTFVNGTDQFTITEQVLGNYD